MGMLISGAEDWFKLYSSASDSDHCFDVSQKSIPSIQCVSESGSLLSMSDSLSGLSFCSRLTSPRFDPSVTQHVVAKFWELKASFAVNNVFALPYSSVANGSLDSPYAMTLSCHLRYLILKV